MSVIYLILAALEILSYSITHISFVNKHSEYVRGSNLAKITGGIIAAIINGICWWYVISAFLKTQNWYVLL